jgi:hypothetical protein
VPNHSCDNRESLTLVHLGYIVKYYCENIDIRFAMKQKQKYEYYVIEEYFPEHYDTLRSRIELRT